MLANAYNDGYVQLWDGERQYGYANVYDPATRHYAGGYGFLSDGVHRWSTNYLDRPAHATFRRIFGMGYYERDETAYDVAATSTVFAPFGAQPVLLSQVTLRNTGTSTKRLRYTEYWDVDPRTVPPRLGSQGATRPEPPSGVRYDHAPRTLVALPARDVSPVPHAIFLTSLTDPITSFETSINRFYGSGTRAAPAELRRARLSDTLLRHGGTGVLFALQIAVTLPPGTSQTALFAYGYDDPSRIAPMVRRLKRGATTALAVSEAHWRSWLPRLSTPVDQWLARETAWNAYYLRSSQTYEDAWHTSFVNQGYTYEYEWGLNIAYRDPLAAILPDIYLAPALARDGLLFAVRAQPLSGNIPYGFTHGRVFSLGPPSSRSDDLDLWLLWTVAEYVLATRDTGFLAQPEPYYGSSRNETVLAHVERAYRHLIHSIGFGTHGEFRMLAGDWSDGEGQTGATESTQTTAQAAWVLGEVARMASLDGRSSFAHTLTVEREKLVRVVARQWTGHWFNRGYRGSRAYGVDSLYLNAQPWALLAGAATSRQAHQVALSIDRLLSRPSPIGMASESRSQGYGTPREKPNGTGTTGGIWYALNGPAIWALAAVDPALAFREYRDNTHAAHAQAYPDNWFGVLSGPDSYDSFESSSPGAVFLPMYPVQDDHAHLWQLYDTIKEAGITATATGFTVAPHWPFRTFSLRTALIGVTYTLHGASGTIHPLRAGRLHLRLRVPPGASDVELQAGRSRRPLAVSGGYVAWTVAAGSARGMTWHIVWSVSGSSDALTRTLIIVGLALCALLAGVAALTMWHRRRGPELVTQ